MNKRVTLATLLTALLAFGVYAAWLAFQVRDDLTDAVSAAADLRGALEADDKPATDRALADLRAHASSAEGHTDGPTWWTLAHLPFVGDDAGAVQVVSSVVDDLANNGVAPLLEAEALGLDGFAPEGGKVDLAKIDALSAPLTKAASAFAEGQRRIDAVDQSGLVGPLASHWSKASVDIADAASGLEAARIAAQVLPPMLGGDGPRKHLVLFQTNAEPRATGGMPGSIARLDVVDGRISLAEQRTAGSFGALPSPVLPLTEEETARFGPQLGTFVSDVGFTPHFPRTAELVAAHWTRETGQQIDGVVAMDPVALGYLMEATGPVTVGNVRLTSQNLAAELLHGAYVRIEQPALQDAWFQAVAGTVFEKIRTGPLDGTKLVEALARGAKEGRIFATSFHADEQAELTGTAIAGEVPSSTRQAPQAGVFLNDSTASKMGWFLDYKVSVRSTCVDGKRTGLKATMDVASTLKPGTKLPVSVTGPGSYGVDVGDHLVSVEIFGPQGGTLDGLTFDGAKQPNAEFSPYLAHPTTSVAVFLEPGSKHRIAWTMDTAASQSAEPVDVRVTAGVQPVNVSVVAPAC